MIGEPGKVEGSGDAWALSLEGKLYAGISGEIKKALKSAVDGGARNILVDCSSLEQVDSSALSAVIAGLKYLKSKGGDRIILISVKDHIKRILSLTKMDQFFPVVEDEAAALEVAGVGADPKASEDA